jgi:septal ring factor EnvC (AmiA/AmiB activator)
MNQSLIERGLMLLGALLILVFALGFVVPAIGAWQSEIRIMVVVGVVLYAAYSFWTQTKDAKDLATKANEAAKWRHEAEQLRSTLNQLQNELREANDAFKMAETAKKKAQTELKKAQEALAKCQATKEV